jgi:hypothetical protein
VLLEGLDRLRMPIFRDYEVLLMETRERTVVLTTYYHVEHDNSRICLENSARVVACRGGLAAERLPERDSQPA